MPPLHIYTAVELQLRWIVAFGSVKQKSEIKEAELLSVT
jgi:hypothetical protein